MLSPDITYQSQAALARYCRTGETADIPGVIPGRLPHYRQLVLNVVEDMLSNAYPLTRSLLGNNAWEKLSEEFFAGNACQSAQVWQMPGEFIPWMENNRQSLLNHYPFLHNLLLFEWTETELFLMEDQPVDCSRNGDLLFSPLVLNPEHRLLEFAYPVHLKKAVTISHEDMGQYWLAAHRNKDGDILFTALSPALYYCIALLAENPMTIQQLFRALETGTGSTLSTADQEGVIHFMQQAFTQHLITGFNN